MTEQNNHHPSKLLRGIAVTLMAITVIFTLLAGVGTTCVALGAENYGSMAVLVPYKPLYQILVVVTLVVGIWGIPVTASLARGGPKVYRNALLVLFIGVISAGIQTGVSQAVRGSSAPVNVRLALTLFTLAIFLVFRLPPLWQRLNFGQSMRGGSRGASAGTALIVGGILTLTTPLWAGPTHLAPTGENWVNVIQTPLMLGGSVLLLSGVGLLLMAVLQMRREYGRLAVLGRRV